MASYIRLCLILFSVAAVNAQPWTWRDPVFMTVRPSQHWLSGWSYRKPITVSAAQVSGTQLNFPVFLSCGDDTDLEAGLSDNLNGKDIRITSGNGVTVLPYELVPDGQYATYAGGWSWFCGPQAIKYGDKVLVGWVSQYEVACGEYDGATTNWVSRSLISGANWPDDHNNPAFVQCSDGKLLAAFSKHNVDGVVHMRTTVNANDATSWQSDAPLTLTGVTTLSYNNLERVTTEGTGLGRIYDFSRYNSTNWGFIYSDDDGTNWTSATPVFFFTTGVAGGAQAYIQVYGDGASRIDFLLANQAYASHSLYHVYYDASDSTWKNTDGTDITDNNDGSTPITLPFSYADLASTSQVWTSVGDTAWIWDVIYDGVRPHVLYVVYPSGVFTGDHQYWYGRWNGAAWDSTEIAVGHSLPAETDYSGGICFAETGASEVYASVYTSGKGEIQLWTRAGGGTWSKTRDITSGSTYDNIRPVVPRGASSGDPLSMVWVGGASYINYNSPTGVRIFPGIHKRWQSAYFQAPSIGGTDQTFYLYYGNPSAADGQNATAIWSGYHFVIHGDISLNDVSVATDSTGNYAPFCNRQNLSGKGFVTYDTNILSPIVTVNLAPSINADYIRVNISPLLASAQNWTLETWYHWLCNASQGTLMTDWSATGTTADVWWRVNQTLTFQGFAIREANTQVGGTIAGLTVNTNAWQLAAFLFKYNDPSNYVLRGRLNTTEGTYTSASGTTMDSNASATSFFIGGGTAGQYISSSFSEMRGVVGTFIDKSVTDTQVANMTNYANFITIGAQETPP